ncbi:MBL fold metallo-hydrolase [Nakamurella antarctica]|uniref:MBL fold metallo-hydrolase n=1 Tax=Nakamurella antarctica TaxID=1902245 RepID=A0A3G8ZXX7_9ACTN|nr:MBL fold metallo-hydrolase [Nakamurella antarctica]AZI58856.1 MBL fold metallo-hydrolase [Nakamurella antarctica]
MLFTQYYVECLSQASYLIGDRDSGQAVIVDPRRDIGEYLADAKANGLTIVGMINTHFHADFVSGHLELADATGAWIGYGEAASTDFPVRHLAEGERISLGHVTLKILATPGHTPESISVLVFEHPDNEIAYGVLTGDALFIGDVGRPDLLASIGFTADQLAIQLFHSVQTVLMGLPDAVRVFPAHGAGSSCGKNLSTERQSTIGEQRRLNYACQPMTQDQFVQVVTADQPSAPPYFVYNAILNRSEREHRPLTASPTALEDSSVDDALAAGALVLDTRTPTDFAAGHVIGSINVGADGRMAETVGMVLDPEQRVVLLSPDGQSDDDAMRMARIGFDHVVGYIPDAEAYLERNASRVEPASRLTARQLADLMESVEGLTVVDLRNPGELTDGVLPGALRIPLAELVRRIDEINLAAPVVVYCAGGWRSSVAASVLRSRGAKDVSDLIGGYSAWTLLHANASG